MAFPLLLIVPIVSALTGLAGSVVSSNNQKAVSNDYYATTRQISDNNHGTIRIVSILLFLFGTSWLGLHYFTTPHNDSIPIQTPPSQITPALRPTNPSNSSPTAPSSTTAHLEVKPSSSEPARGKAITSKSAFVSNSASTVVPLNWKTRIYHPHFEGWYSWTGKYILYLLGLICFIGLFGEGDEGGCMLSIISVLSIAIAYWI
jgi:hypothetical protein